MASTSAAYHGPWKQGWSFRSNSYRHLLGVPSSVWPMFTRMSAPDEQLADLEVTTYIPAMRCVAGWSSCKEQLLMAAVAMNICRVVQATP